MEFILEQMVGSTKVNGKMISLMDMVSSCGWMETFSKEISEMERSMERASTFGRINHFMMENGLKERLKAKASISILMAESIKVNGKII